MERRGRLTGRGFAEACETLDAGRLVPGLFRLDLCRRLRLERRDTANAITSKPRARPGPTMAGNHSTGREGNDGDGAVGSDGPGVPVPNSGAQPTLGVPPPTPCAPFDAETESHCASSQLSTTLSAPKSRSMSLAHGTPLVAALIEKPHAALNSSSTRPCGPNSVSIA